MAKLNRDLDIELDRSFLRGSVSGDRSVGVILHFDKGTICQVKEHFNEGIHGRVEICFPQSFGHILLYKIPDTWIEDI